MKTSRIIKLNDEFSIKINHADTGSNYTQFAHVLYKGEKAPHFGTCFKETDTNTKIKAWAIERINAPYNDPLLKTLQQH